MTLKIFSNLNDTVIPWNREERQEVKKYYVER